MAWNSYPASKLLVDSVWGKATVYALQHWLRRRGYYGTAYALDGQLGVYSIKAWQRMLRDKGRNGAQYTGLIDGYMGKMTITAACEFLLSRGSVYTPGAQDGYYILNNNSEIAKTFPDYHLTQAWQRFLNDHRYG